MNIDQRTSTDKLIEAYLRELELAMTGRDPRERAETLEMIRQHIDEALPASPTKDEVQGVLSGLGSPADIAEAVEPAPLADVAHDRGVDTYVWSLLAMSVAAMILLLPLPLVAVAVALLTGVGAVFQLRRGDLTRRSSAVTKVALILAVAVVAVAAVAALLLWPAGSTVSVPTPAVPVG